MVQKLGEAKPKQDANVGMTKSDLNGRGGLLDTFRTIGGRTITYNGQDNGALLTVKDSKDKKSVKVAVGEEKEGIKVVSVDSTKCEASVKVK